MKILSVPLLLITCAELLAAEVQMPDPETLRLLRSGAVTVETVRDDESGGAARFLIYMDAPVEEIWKVIYSCEMAFIFLDGLKLCEVLEDDGINTITRQVVKTAWLVPTQDYTFRTHREPFRRANFERIEGSPKVMEGSWNFVVMPQGVVVIHEIRVKPDRPVPRFIIRRLMRNSMPDMLACIRGLAGGSPGEDRRREDSGACPGKRK